MRLLRVLISGLGPISAVLLGLSWLVAPAEGQGGIGRIPWYQCFDGDAVIVVLQPTKNKIPREEIALPTPAGTSNEKTSTFQVVKVLKGAALIKIGDFVEVAASEPDDVKRPLHAWLGRYPVFSDEKQTKSWAQVLPISATFQSYLEMLLTPMPPQKRLLEYYRFWKTEDAEVLSDVEVYFRNCEFKELLPLRRQIDHDFIVRRAQDNKQNAFIRSIAFKLLAIAGKANDKEWLQAYIQGIPGRDEKDYNGDDRPAEAIVAFVALAGDDGVRWLEKEILKDARARRHLDALFALRDHARSGHLIPRDNALRGLHTALNIPQPHPLVIEMLMELKDWSVLDRVGQVGLDAAAKNNLSLQELHNSLRYLFACPRPEAKSYLAKMKNLSPKSYDYWDRARHSRK